MTLIAVNMSDNIINEFFIKTWKEKTKTIEPSLQNFDISLVNNLSFIKEVSFSWLINDDILYSSRVFDSTIAINSHDIRFAINKNTKSYNDMINHNVFDPDFLLEQLQNKYYNTYDLHINENKTIFLTIINQIQQQTSYIDDTSSYKIFSHLMNIDIISLYGIHLIPYKGSV